MFTHTHLSKLSSDISRRYDQRKRKKLFRHPMTAPTSAIYSIPSFRLILFYSDIIIILKNISRANVIIFLLI